MSDKRQATQQRRFGFMLGVFVLGMGEGLFWCLAQMPTNPTGNWVADMFSAIGIALVMLVLAVAVVVGLTEVPATPPEDREPSDA